MITGTLFLSSVTIPSADGRQSFTASLYSNNLAKCFSQDNRNLYLSLAKAIRAMATTPKKKHNYPKKRKSPTFKLPSVNQHARTRKFMQVVTEKQWKELRRLAVAREMTIQEYIRFNILPDFLFKVETTKKILKELPSIELAPPGTSEPVRLHEENNPHSDTQANRP